MPTEEEAKSFSGWLSKAGHSMEQLSAPERFLAVMGAVPRIRAKCAALLFRAQLPGLLADVHAALQCLLTACAQVPVSPPQRAAFWYYVLLALHNAVVSIVEMASRPSDCHPGTSSTVLPPHQFCEAPNGATSPLFQLFSDGLSICGSFCHIVPWWPPL